MSAQNAFPAISDPTYRIEEELGSGGGAVIYKAWHSRLKKYVVLKRIKDDSGLLQSSRERGEVDILKNLKHMHLPQIYDFLTEPSGVYTVMEYIPGQSFYELQRSGKRFNQAQVVPWAQQLTSALAYLHGQNPPVLHSDINPRNIMLTPEGNLCLIDFNISLVLTGDSTEAIGLSHGYASPEQYGPQGLPPDMQIAPKSQSTFHHEQTYTETELIDDNSETEITDHENEILGQSNNTTEIQKTYDRVAPVSSSAKRRFKIRIDTRSDIYSVGATLYHLVTGEKPSISTGQIKPVSEFERHISEAFVYIIERCMERDPAKRFQTAAKLHDAISNIHKLDGRWKSHRTRTAISATVIAALLIVFSMTTALGWQRMSSEKIESYNNLVLEIATSQNDAPFDAATAIFPEKPDAYREQALKLCNLGNYEECINYIKYIMAKLSAFAFSEIELKQIGNIYYIQGNAYFEIEDYPNSLLSYEAAFANNPDNPEMCRDYAIALARCGYIDRADKLLNDIKGMDLGNDSINLLRGEIAYAKGNDEYAIEFFKEVFRRTSDANLRNRACLICDKVYRNIPDLVNDDIDLLREAMQNLPENFTLVLKERLADALVRNGNYTEALSLFEEILSGGNISYQTWQNIGVLYQQTGDYSNARETFDELAAMYPDDYRPPMRLAFLVLEEQSKRANENRNYCSVAAYYEQAQKLCKTDDMEMLQLASLVAELRQNGWIH